MSYLLAIETAVPEFKYSQKEIVAFYQKATEDEGIKRKIKIIGEKAAIETRYSVIEDFGKEVSEFTFFPKNKNLLPEPSISARMDLYKQHALDLSVEAIYKIKNFETVKHTITHIITVTCTGLFAPGLDIELIKKLELSAFTQRNSINFMGCNAAILALKYADAICNSTKNATVLIVCAELSTIHFQTNFTDDYLLSTSLFGDGCAAALVSSNYNAEFGFPKLEIQSFYSMLLHQGKADMAWNISEKGFILNLSSYVSKLINTNIKTLFSEVNLTANDINYWAIHPGGKKIIDDFCDSLELSKNDLKESYRILKDYGNMSSPTVLFVLKEIITNTSHYKTNETIFSAAFGPGLSIETMQLKYV